MKLHFDPNQQFRHDAINAIIEIFEGQHLNQGDFSFSMSNESYMFHEGGVGNRLEITFEHFQNLYDKTLVKFDVYDSKRVSNVRNFAISNNIQILVINIDSFVKDENIINKSNDKLTGKKLIEFFQATTPIVIVDKPQNMETVIRKKAVENLNPLCTLRYSVTHIDRYNIVLAIRDVLTELMIEGIKCEKIGQKEYEMRLFEDVKYRQVATVGELDST